ncbi:integrase [Sphingobium sp. Ant17]|nr:integrase [Sphingobium sp. Ant17]
MPKMKLTKTNIDRVRKPGTGTVIYVDTETKGFGLRVTASGAASFIVQRMIAGQSKERRITIGEYGVFTVDQARTVAEEYIRTMKMGIDPIEVKKAEIAKRAEDELLAVSLQEVLESYVARPGKLKASTAAEYRRHVEKVFASWKDKPIASITRDMVQERHREIAEKGLEGKKAAPASANAAFVTLRILFRYAMDEYVRADGEPVIERNPVTALKNHWAETGDRTERYIDKAKVGAVWNKLQEDRADPRSRDALAGIDLTIFLLLTGARRDEAAALTWDRVVIDDHNPSESRWHLINRKRGKPIWLPLSSQAVALLKSRPRRTLEDGTESPFVFPSWGKTGRIMDARATMETVGEIAGQHLSLHDLRRTFTNICIRECRVGKFETDLLTGHKPPKNDTTSNNYFDLTNLQWLHKEVQQIGDWIEQQGLIAAAGNVVALPKRA